MPEVQRLTNETLEFVSLLVLHLLVDDYIDGHHTTEFEHPISLPPFVRHYLHAKCRELDFTFIISLLKDLLSISQHRYLTLICFLYVKTCTIPGGRLQAKFGCQPIKLELYLHTHTYTANHVSVHSRHLGVYKESRVPYRAIRVRVS